MRQGYALIGRAPAAAVHPAPRDLESPPVRILAVLAFLFALRVLGQLAVVVFQPAFLPPMEAWYSGLIPYPILLPLQAAILALQFQIGRDLARGRGWFAVPRRWAGRPLRRFSCAYFAVMAARYPLALALAPGAPWYRGVIPIAFHWVLAAYLFVLGGWHRRALAAGDRLAGRSFSTPPRPRTGDHPPWGPDRRSSAPAPVARGRR